MIFHYSHGAGDGIQAKNNEMIRRHRKEEISLLDDMLSISFPNGFVYFYIGKSSSKLCAIAKNRASSYMWLFDEQAENSFYLSSTDENLDFKLLSMFRLFDRTIDAVLFGQVEL